MSAISVNESRRSERISLSLSAVVKGKPSRDEFWKETIDLISISRTGAGFYIEKQCNIGQLISLIMPMPRHLRCYDFDKELYRVWGLVQHCSPVSSNGNSVFHVGVAFVGRQSPASYGENPLQSYRISGMNEEGTWKIVEAQASFVVRRHPRFWLSLAVSLSALNSEENIISDDNCFTENISLSGAAVFSTLNVDVGESVKFNCKKPDFSALSIVRNRQTSDYELPKLHLEFIDAEFPMDKVALEHQTETVSVEQDDEPIVEPTVELTDEPTDFESEELTSPTNEFIPASGAPVEEFVKF